MIRLKISNFIKKHKAKIYDLGVKIVTVAMIVFIATVAISSLTKSESDYEEEVSNVYKPTQTIIQGSDVSKEQYEKDSNLVNKFLEHCNNKEIEEAYNLLSDECKETMYAVIEMFKQNYYDFIFNRRRECNLQAWISTSEYTIYKVRYTNNMMATGTYDENDVYEDYLTLNKKNNTEKVSIGNFIDSEACNIVTKTDNIEATVNKKTIYLTYEEYEINIKNNMSTTLLLNNLKNGKDMKLITDYGTEYSADINRFFLTNLIINSGESRKVTIRFNKSINTDNNSKRIEISNIIKDYDTYTQNEEGYTDTTNITIKVED